jgi:hypothetical protein
MQESRHSCLTLYLEEYEKLTLQAILITNAQTSHWQSIFISLQVLQAMF